MRTRLIKAAALAAILTASAAASSALHAADLYGGPPPQPLYDAPPPAEQHLFEGWWIGGTIGGATADFDFSANNTDIATSGILGGVTGGWNWRDGPIVIGLEGDVVAADVNGRRRFNAGANVAKPSIDTMADLRLRAGVAVVPQLLLFATAGGAWADIDLPVGGPGGGAGDGTFFGWSVGGGAEFAFNQNWSARFDYQFTDFDTDTVSYPGGKIKYDPDMSTYRGSLIYRF